MPLRRFEIGPAGEEVYPRFVEELARRFDDAKSDRNVTVREALATLYLGAVPDFEKELADPKTTLARKALLASFDPRNATLEAEYYREIDLAKWAPVKPLLWFWQMFDHSPVGRNVRLGTRMRAMLAARVFRKCGRGRPHLPRRRALVRLQPHGRQRCDDPSQRPDRRPRRGDHRRRGLDLRLREHLLALARRRGHPRRLAAQDGDRKARARDLPRRVLSGVVVGDDAMVGSMGVASKPIADGVIAAGIPAKPIGQKKIRGSS